MLLLIYSDYKQEIQHTLCLDPPPGGAKIYGLVFLRKTKSLTGKCVSHREFFWRHKLNVIPLRCFKFFDGSHLSHNHTTTTFLCESTSVITHQQSLARFLKSFWWIFQEIQKLEISFGTYLLIRQDF